MFDKWVFCLSQYTGVNVMYNVSKQSGQNWIMTVGLKLVKKREKYLLETDFNASNSQIKTFYLRIMLVRFLGAIADSRYIGQRDITDRDILELQCTIKFDKITYFPFYIFSNFLKAGIYDFVKYL